MGTDVSDRAWMMHEDAVYIYIHTLDIYKYKMFYVFN